MKGPYCSCAIRRSVLRKLEVNNKHKALPLFLYFLYYILHDTRIRFLIFELVY